MTTITAEIIEDSLAENGKRLTTFELVYPRWIHAEGRTHRVISEDEEYDWPTPSPMADKNLSRNASSSRAIPVANLIRDVMKNPAVPMFWGANQKGMQAGAECDELVNLYSPYVDDTDGEYRVAWLVDQKSREDAWLWARDQAVTAAKAFADAGYHKQIVNRLLEPFSHIKAVYTATEWENFIELRDHEMAEPHIQLLARKMKLALRESRPKLLRENEWHLPYVTPEERKGFTWKPHRVIGIYSSLAPMPIRMSVARCARTSYLTHGGVTPRPEEDAALYDRLVGSTPLHASPAEHQGTPYQNASQFPGVTGNFYGFRQYRKLM